MKLVNLTPHEMNICDEGGDEIFSVEPSGDVARVEVEHAQVGSVQGAPLYEAQSGPVKNLPKPRANVLFIVSGFVASKTDRGDVVSPGKLIRDEDGRPVGAKGLVTGRPDALALEKVTG